MELDKDFNLIVGLRIREIREVLQMTRAEFSEMCDISESFLTAVESGKKVLPLKHSIRFVLLRISLPIISSVETKKGLKQMHLLN